MTFFNKGFDNMIKKEYLMILQQLYYFNNKRILEFVDKHYDELTKNEYGDFVELLLQENSSSKVQQAVDKANKIFQYLLSQNHIKCISYESEDYPEEKMLILEENRPALLYYIGNISLLKAKSVAVIGTREPEEAYAKYAFQIGYNLAKQQYCVVSGLALGCDTEAHLGTLKAKGKTIAVLANGLDTVYPKENENLANDIYINEGCIISEYPPKTKIEKWYFANRDRLQSALSEVIIVIQTAAKGGTMITADYAFHQKKKLYAINPDNENYKSSGNIILINSKKVIPIAIEEISKFKPTVEKTTKLDDKNTLKNNTKKDKKIEQMKMDLE